MERTGHVPELRVAGVLGGDVGVDDEEAHEVGVEVFLEGFGVGCGCWV